MAFEDGNPPVFDGNDFQYWKVRMAYFLEAAGTKVWRVTVEGYNPPVDPHAPTVEEELLVKANAKDKNLLYGAMIKEVFNRICSCATSHDIWTALELIHEGSKSVRNDRYDGLIKKFNNFVMNQNERVNDMYSRLNVLVEEIKALNVKRITDEDVVRKIISILPRPEYQIITTLLRQEDLESMTPADILGRIAAHELYELDGVLATSSSTPSKNLALKIEHEPRRRKVAKEDSSDDDDNEDISSIIKATMKLMSRLNKKGLEFNPKTGRFSPMGDQSHRKMVCYNCGEKGHISPKCSKPKKPQERGKNKGKAPFSKKKNFKSQGHAYVGEWLSSDDEDEDEQEEDEEDSSNDEDVAGVAITCESPLPPPPMCFMAKGGAKKKKKQDPRKGTWDEATDSEFEEEEVAPKKGNKKKEEVLREEIINSDSEDEDEEVTVESLLPKLNCVMKQLLKEHAKVKALTRDNNELIKGLEEYDESYEELRTKYDYLVSDHDNLKTRHEKLSIEHEELKISHTELECSLNEKVPSNTPSSNDGISSVAKGDASTSCQNLLYMA